MSNPLDGNGVAWACVTCNSPRSVDPCPKCGTSLTKPADGWEWPGLPDIDHIRALAREVGYAVGVHGSLERDLDLIAAPWVADAVGPLELARHIASGLGGEVVDYARQDKPCGRWSCNIHTPDWTKMIDLSVMPPVPAPSHTAVEPVAELVERLRSVATDEELSVADHATVVEAASALTAQAAEAATLKARVAELEAAGKRIEPYLAFTVGPESPGCHPTMPSAVASFRATLARRLTHQEKNNGR